MIPYADMTGLASDAIAIAVAAVMLPGVAGIAQPYRIALAALVAAVLLIPLGNLPPAAYLRGAIGDLSITSQLLLLMAILRPMYVWPLSGELHAPSPSGGGLGWGNEGGKYTLLSLIALAALGLYPMALGIGSFDPYRLGYGDPWFLGSLLVISVLAYFRRLWLPVCVIVLAVLAWTAGWYESTNLWDYLLDPLLAVYAIGVLLRQGARILSGNHQT
ncbi:MAG: hypothetical protein WA435_12785 [Gallionellaceae bacterium]